MLKWAPKVLLLLFLTLGVYELLAITVMPPGLTISEQVWGATARYPVVAFFAGVLCGHFFWQRRP